MVKAVHDNNRTNTEHCYLLSDYHLETTLTVDIAYFPSCH